MAALYNLVSLFLLFENSILPTNTVCRGIVHPCKLFCRGILYYTPANCVCGGILFSCCASACPSITFCFFNTLKSHYWNFIKPCKHIHWLLYGFCICIVPSCANQLLPQLLLNLSNTLPIQSRHIEHMLKEYWCKKYFLTK